VSLKAEMRFAALIDAGFPDVTGQGVSRGHALPVVHPEMAFKPLHDRVLVRRVESDEKTKGGLIIPDSAKEKPAEGEVIAVGAGAKDDDGDRIAMDVKAGDRILFGKWSGTEVTIDGEELLIMKESDILGIIDRPLPPLPPDPIPVTEIQRGAIKDGC
jgi:chaperonin GroES